LEVGTQRTLTLSTPHSPTSLCPPWTASRSNVSALPMRHTAVCSRSSPLSKRWGFSPFFLLPFFYSSFFGVTRFAHAVFVLLVPRPALLLVSGWSVDGPGRGAFGTGCGHPRSGRLWSASCSGSTAPVRHLSSCSWRRLCLTVRTRPPTDWWPVRSVLYPLASERRVVHAAAAVSGGRRAHWPAHPAHASRVCRHPGKHGLHGDALPVQGASTLCLTHTVPSPEGPISCGSRTHPGTCAFAFECVGVPVRANVWAWTSVGVGVDGMRVWSGVSEYVCPSCVGIAHTVSYAGVRVGMWYRREDVCVAQNE
jgi:hypothetical protein